MWQAFHINVGMFVSGIEVTPFRWYVEEVDSAEAYLFLDIESEITECYFIIIMHKNCFNV